MQDAVVVKIHVGEIDNSTLARTLHAAPQLHNTMLSRDVHLRRWILQHEEAPEVERAIGTLAAPSHVNGKACV